MAVGLNASGDSATRTQAVGGVGIAGLTLCGWVRFPTALQAGPVYTLRHGGNGRAIYLEVGVPSTTPELRFGDSQTGLTSFTAQPAADTWLFCALSCTAVGSGDTITAYWSAEGSSTWNSNSRANGVENSVSAEVVEVRGSSANGVWHEHFRAYNSALTLAELQAIKSAATPAGGELFWWPLATSTDNSDAVSGGTRPPTLAGTLTTQAGPTLGGGGAFTITAESGSFTETGTAASLEFGRVIPADGGSYALTGANAGTLAGRRVTADTGSLALAGTDAAAEFGRLLAADLGAYALTGTDAGLSRTVAGAYALSAEAGSFALSGGEATLTAPVVALGGSHDAAVAEWEARRRLSRLPSLAPERVEPETGGEVAGDAAGSAVAPQPGKPLGTLADALLRAGVPQAVAKRGEYVVDRGPKARIRVPAPVPVRIEDEEAVAMLLLLMEAA